jgi:hypothetical protein
MHYVTHVPPEYDGKSGLNFSVVQLRSSRSDNVVF